MKKVFVLAFVMLMASLVFGGEWGRAGWNGASRNVTGQIQFSAPVSFASFSFRETFTTNSLTDTVTGAWGDGAIAFVSLADTADLDSAIIYVDQLNETQLIVRRASPLPSGQAYNALVVK